MSQSSSFAVFAYQKCLVSGKGDFSNISDDILIYLTHSAVCEIPESSLTVVTEVACREKTERVAFR